MKLIIFIDGDNAPKNRIEGIDLLRPNDELYILAAKHSGEYFTDNRMHEIRDKCVAKISKMSVPLRDNAVDFTVTAFASQLIDQRKNEPNIYVLVSEDKHFRFIVESLRELYPPVIIYNTTSIKRIINKMWPLLCENTDDIMWYLHGIMGEENGNKAYNALCNMFNQPQQKQARKWWEL